MSQTGTLSRWNKGTHGNLAKMLLIGVVILVASAFSSCRSGDGTGKSIVLYGFSALENVMKEEIIPAFQRDWREKTGREVKVITSFAGSGTITNQIIFGAPAQVAMVSTEMDALNMKQAGLVTTDWRTFPNEGTFAYSIACIVTRKGNPKGIHSFDDTAKQGVEVVYPDPTTSGGAQWAIIALYGAALKTSELAKGVADPVFARQRLKLVSLNAGSLPESARRALTQFGLGFGDALLTYENEIGWEKRTPKSDKIERRRCQYERCPSRKIHEGIPPGSSEAGNGREAIIAGGSPPVVPGAIDVRVLGEGTKGRQTGRCRQDVQALD